MLKRRSRKPLGTAMLVTLVVVYALAAMMLAAAILPGAPAAAALLYYLVAGLAWIVPAGAVIRWMSRPDPGG